MKRPLLLLVLSLISVVALAQKAEELKNSYNYKRGTELLAQDTPDEAGALKCFQNEVAEHPKNGYAWYFMGLIYENNSQEGDALESLNKAVQFLKKDKEWISYAYRQRAKVQLQLKHDDLALADWEASLKANHDDQQTLLDRAEYYYDKGEYDLSDADYDKMIKAAPGQTLGYKGKARNANHRKNYQQALELCSYAITLDPSDASAYAHRAEAYMGLGQYSEAADDIIQALNLNSGSFAFYMLQDFKKPEADILLAKLRIQQAKDKTNSLWSFFEGVVYEQNDDYDNAIKLYNAANDIAPDDATMNRIASCYASKGDYQQALTYVHRAMVMDSTYYAYPRNEADYLCALGFYGDAITAISKYIEKYPDDIYGYVSRAQYEMYSGKTDDAITDFTTAIVISPDFPYAYFLRGDCRKRKGDTEAAMADYRKAAELDTTATGGYGAKYAYYELGDKAKAIAMQDSALAHEPDKDDCYDAACLYARMGDTDKAMEYMRTAMEKGYRNFQHIKEDWDMDNLRDRDDFKALIKQYRQQAQTESGNKNSAPVIEEDAEVAPESVSEIPFTRNAGGLCQVKCTINGLPLSFWLDTGASDVSMSQVEATFMIKNGYLTRDDIVGSSYFYDANGNVSVGTVINLRKVTFGNSELNNVRASVVANLKAPLLLGQTVLSRLGSVEVDNAKQVIRIKGFK